MACRFGVPIEHDLNTENTIMLQKHDKHSLWKHVNVGKDGATNDKQINCISFTTSLWIVHFGAYFVAFTHVLFIVLYFVP